MIDDDLKLALAFQTRKLQLKALKSWIIVKMHRIHKAHLLRLSRQYRSKSTMHKFWQRLKVFTKIVAPRERMRSRAKAYRLKTLKQRVM